MILAGDIGGTKTQLALFQAEGPHLKCHRTARFPSIRYADLGAVLREFLAPERGRIRQACFGVAGPVVEGRAQTPNLPWVIDEAGLRRQLRTRRVRLLNDLEAMAYGVLDLPRRDLTPLQDAPPRRGNAAVIAAGTGLGEALLIWNGKRHHPVATEGGHADFAPRNGEEHELLQYLLRDFERVSYERVLSGPGLFAIYRFLRDTGRGRESRTLAKEIAAGDPAAVVASWGLARRSPLCVRTLECFGGLYGAEAGNLAMRAMAVGGLYLGGGIAPKILPALAGGTFLRGFLAKGRMRPLLETIPVHVIRNQRTPLLGAARFATTL